MPDHDKVLCVQFFGLIEVKPGRHAFGFAHTYALSPDVAPSRLDDALRSPAAEHMAGLPLEWR